MTSDEPDAPSILTDLTGYPREQFEYTGEIRDLSEMELSPIDASDLEDDPDEANGE